VTRPSFEFWLLLHFEYSVRPFRSADPVIDLLSRHVTDYDKADRQIFAKVRSGLDRALTHVPRLKAELAATGARSPDTDMPTLIQKMLSLSRQRPG
jgi:RloB-like protein